MGQFVVDCTNAGPAELTIEIISDNGTEAEVHIQDNGDGTYSIKYIPLHPGAYTLTIRYGGQDVPNFPSRLNVEPAVDTSQVKVFGPGVEGKGMGGFYLSIFLFSAWGKTPKRTLLCFLQESFGKPLQISLWMLVV